MADILASVDKFLRGMDWTSPERNIQGESVPYRWILGYIAQFYRNEHSQDLITPPLVGTLTSVFSRLTEVDNWEDIRLVYPLLNLWECRDILVHRRADPVAMIRQPRQTQLTARMSVFLLDVVSPRS